MNRIEIRRDYASLEITSRRAQLYIETPRPEMKVVSSSSARMVVRRTAPRLRVNWDKVRVAPQYHYRMESRARADEALSVQQTSARDGRDVKLDASQSAAIQGLRVSRARTSAMRQAEMNGQPHPIQARAANIASALEWELGSVDIDWEIDPGKVEWAISRPRVEVEPYSVEVRMRRYPRLYITYNPENVVKVTGRKLDKRI